MKIYATNNLNGFEQFDGKDLWVKCYFQDSIWGMEFSTYINIVDIYNNRICFRRVDSDFIVDDASWEFGDVEGVSWELDRFLTKYTIAQPLTVISTEDMEEILGTKLTHIEDWY